MSLTHSLARGVAVLALVATLIGTAGCALFGGTLGGREKCWPEGDSRAPSLWRGNLRIDATGGRLDTPEGEVIPLLPGGALTIRSGSGGGLLHGGEILATAGQDVTLFGGAGSDGFLIVCAVEEVHSAS